MKGMLSICISMAQQVNLQEGLGADQRAILGWISDKCVYDRDYWRALLDEAMNLRVP